LGRPRYTFHIFADGTSEFFPTWGKGKLEKAKTTVEKETAIAKNYDII
jgi:hypothetical protein